MLKILQARVQQYVNQEFPDTQAGFRKGRGSRDHIAYICLIIEKAREFQKNIYFCFIDYAKDFDCVDHSKLWKFLKEMGIPDHLTCLLRNVYAGLDKQKLKPDMEQWTGSKLGKMYIKANILSPYLFYLCAEYIMWNAMVDEAQAGIQIVSDIPITSYMQMVSL